MNAKHQTRGRITLAGLACFITIALLGARPAQAQAEFEWTWMKGPSTADQPGVYGTQGVPALANNPGARTNAASWTDESGRFWLFGGDGIDGAGKEGILNDLWRYNPATGNWTWVKGPSTAYQEGSTDYQPGVYGTQGIPAPENTPGPRVWATTWADGMGGLWLFGGVGVDGGGNIGPLNDLWKYDLASGNWTWMKGASTIDQPGVYGTQGIPAPANTPGARPGAVSWTDGLGGLWLFGGGGGDNFNDLWRYDLATGNWTWMKGPSTRRQPGVYGTQGIPAPENTPGARWFATGSWVDSNGGLWLFGGDAYDINGDWAWINDLWRYDPATGNWTWMKGASTVGQSGVYGTQGIPAPANTPGLRAGAVSWTDSAGGLWLFGGDTRDISDNFGWINDLWRYDTVSGNWTWMKGSSTVNQPGAYGTQGIRAPENTPGARTTAVSFIDNSGSLWLFGGTGEDDSWPGGFLSDLWRGDPPAGPRLAAQPLWGLYE